MSKSLKNIVIVGGGSAGGNAAKALCQSLDHSKYQLILINPLPYRIWLIATLRMLVTHDEKLRQDSMLPYDRVLGTKGKFVQGVVKSVDASEKGGSVTLESGETINYHVLLLAQGATWTGPPAFPRSENGVKEHIKSIHNRIAKANNIVLVGGGAVGIELSGEIKERYPEKTVTLVHGEKRLLNPAYPDKTRIAMENSLRSTGIELILDDFVDFAETKEVQGISTRSGRELKNADFVIQTRGPRPNTEFVSASLGPESLSKQGLIRIRPTLQLAEYDNIFAAGDVIDWKEQKQAAKSSIHGRLAAANIQASLNGNAMKPYKGLTEMIAITNGKDRGIVYFDFLWGIMLGDWFARLAKSKALLVPRYQGEQGY